jgi:DNA-binding transcriptional LysR family regulator
MELRQLRYFIAVAEEMNITRAAGRLHMTQPPLSRQIQQIEESVGLPLFEHGSRPLRLTEAGRVFYAQAKRLIDESDELVPLTRRLAQLAERIVIGFVPSTLYGALPQVIRAFREAAPQIELSLIEMFTLEQLGALKGGRIDVGFGRLRFDDVQLTREVLVEERMIAALPEDHPLVMRTSSYRRCAIMRLNLPPCTKCGSCRQRLDSWLREWVCRLYPRAWMV